jgi:integrase
VAEAQVLGILRDVYAFMYAFLIQTVAVSQLHKQLAETKDIEMARKANGQGHTYKVGNSYRTVIRKGDHSITAMATTAQESRRLAKEKVELQPNLLSKSSLPVARMRFEDYLINWLEDEHKHTIAHSTYKRYLALAKFHINPVLGEIEVQKLSSSDITKMLAVMREAGQSARSQQQARALLSVALRDAEYKGYILINPVTRVRNPQGKRIEISPLTIEEVKRLLNTYSGTYLGGRLHIALICGLRQGESLGLTWDAVDLEARTIRVSKQVQIINGVQVFTDLKTEKSSRLIALTEETTAALRGHLSLIEQLKERAGSSWVENNLVFPDGFGNFRSPKTDYAEWKKALKLCGIASKRLHDARHTAATLMYSQGVGIETISRALGHSTSAITSKLYVHNSVEPQKVAAEVMNQLLID